MTFKGCSENAIFIFLGNKFNKFDFLFCKSHNNLYFKNNSEPKLFNFLKHVL